MMKSDVMERLKHLNSKMDYNSKVRMAVNALEEEAVESFCIGAMDTYHALVKEIGEKQKLYI